MRTDCPVYKVAFFGSNHKELSFEQWGWLILLWVLILVIAPLMIYQNVFAQEITLSNETNTTLQTTNPTTHEIIITDEGFSHSTLTIKTGDTVVWNNKASTNHSVTSGKLDEGIDGVFDSSLIRSGQTFQLRFLDAGVFDYFCLNHNHWQGTIIVEGESKQFEPPTIPQTTDVYISVVADDLVQGMPASIRVEFADQDGQRIKGMMYNITAKQNGKTILEEKNILSETGLYQHDTEPLESTDPLDVSVITAEKTITAKVIPEFPFAIIVIGIGIGATLLILAWIAGKSSPIQGKESDPSD